MSKMLKTSQLQNETTSLKFSKYFLVKIALKIQQFFKIHNVFFTCITLSILLYICRMNFPHIFFCIKCKKVLVLSTFVQMCFLKKCNIFCGLKTSKFQVDFCYILWLLSAINLDVKKIY